MPTEITCPKCKKIHSVTDDWPDDCSCGHSFVDEILKNKAPKVSNLEDIQSEEFERRDVTEELVPEFAFGDREEFTLDSI